MIALAHVLPPLRTTGEGSAMTGGVNSQHAWPDEGATRVPVLVYQDASNSGNSKCHRARRGRNLAARHSREHPAAADVAALRSARRLAIWRASRVHVGNGAAGLAKPAVLVPAAPGNGAARRGDRYDVRPDARMRAPDRLRLAPRQRSGRLDRRRAERL